MVDYVLEKVDSKIKIYFGKVIKFYRKRVL